MAEEDLEALVILTPDNFLYATGYFLDVAPWERPVACVIPRDSEPFLLMHELSTNYLAHAGERGELFIEEYHLYSEHPRVSDRLPLLPQWPQTLADLLRRRGVTTGRIGVDQTTGPVGPAIGLLPRAQLVDASAIPRDLRLIKHPEELEWIRRGGKLTDWAQERFKDGLKPGRLVLDLDLSVNRDLAVEAARTYPEIKVESRLLTLSGPVSACPHGVGGDSGIMTFERGHTIVNIIVLRLNGYWCENERTWFLGEPGARQAAAFEAATAANQAAMAAFRPGTPMQEVDAAAQREFERAGFGAHIRHRTGHGIGLAGHEHPADMAFNPRPLVPGEVYSCEPGIYLRDLGGFRQDDIVIVTERGPESVTSYPRDLASLTVAA
jgi:Xaa-Pro aminopeptidase